MRDIGSRVKGAKDKMKVSYPTVIYEYNQHMAGVDENKLKRRSKCRLYLRIFFDFLNISVVNFNIIYHEIDSTVGTSAIDFCFSLARSMNKRIKRREFWYC